MSPSSKYLLVDQRLQREQGEGAGEAGREQEEQGAERGSRGVRKGSRTNLHEPLIKVFISRPEIAEGSREREGAERGSRKSEQKEGARESGKRAEQTSISPSSKYLLVDQRLSSFTSFCFWSSSAALWAEQNTGVTTVPSAFFKFSAFLRALQGKHNDINYVSWAPSS